jgi:predicted transcriptional regulator of viral defense system
MSNIAKKLLILANSGKTVFNTADLRLLWRVENERTLWANIVRAIEKKYLERLRRGLYKISEREVDNFEFAGKLKKRSYISFETVLAKEGVIHQWYGSVFSATDRNSLIENKIGRFRYYRLPDKILADRTGIINSDGRYFIATAERAFCDTVYRSGLTYFDDLTELDKKKLKEVAKIYDNKRLSRNINQVIKSI